MALVTGIAVYFNQVVKPGVVTQIIAANTPPPPAVSVAEVKSVARRVRFHSIGTLQAVHQVAVAPEVGGRVVKVLFDSGDRLHSGMPMVQLNDAPDQADLQNFQAQADLAARTFSRASELARDQFGPIKTVDESREQLRRAVTGIAKASAVIAQKRIDAPFDGQVGVREVEIGQYLNPGSPIATLTDIDHLRVNFSLPERERARLHPGLPIDLRVDAFPSRTFNAILITKIRKSRPIRAPSCSKHR